MHQPMRDFCATPFLFICDDDKAAFVDALFSIEIDKRV